ncbi:MAG: hypothetical protein HKL88_06360 [Bacteroidia bacterium]|nr:hypothetical protein [Bacteroidia bacterium]
MLVILNSENLKAQPVNAATEHWKKMFTQANLMMGEHFYDSALMTFTSMYKTDSANANVCYNIGQLYLLTTAYKSKSLPYLEKAAAHVTGNYHPDDAYEKDAPAIAYYYLARAQHLNYKFDEAIQNFSRFKKLLTSDADTIDYWINCCNNAKDLMQYPVDCKIINLGDSVNSPYPDFAPIITADEQELFFTSCRPLMNGDSNRDLNKHYYEDIWISYAKPGGGWTQAANIGQPVNTPRNDKTISVSPDGQQLIIYQDNSIFSEGANGSLKVTYLRGTQWSYPEAIDSNDVGVVNSNSYEPSCCISPDQRTIIFASKRAGGFGGTDLYKITIESNGKWDDPVNLGSLVNTQYDEDAPFIHPDDSTLFFSSKGHNTMGGFDVFSARENASGNWGKIKNLGYPVNSPDDDLYFYLSADGRRAFYTSIRNGGSGERDIYEVIFNKPLPVDQVAVLDGYIKNADGSRLPNDLKITACPVGSNNAVTTGVNYATGKFLQVMRPNTNYNITITTQGKTVFNQKFLLSSDSSYSSLARAFFRSGIILGDTTNVFAPKKKAAEAVVAKAREVKTENMTGKILLNNSPIEPLSEMELLLADNGGRVIQTTATGTNGAFTFTGLNPDSTYLLEFDAKESKLRPKKLLLLNSNNKTVRNFDGLKRRTYCYHSLPADLNKLPEIPEENEVAVNPAPAPPDTIVTTVKGKAGGKENRTKKTLATSAPDFIRYFGYNTNAISEQDDGFSALIDKITAALATDKVNVTIVASASKVPTHIFTKGNKGLALDRAKLAEEVIKKALNDKHAEMKNLNLRTEAKVSGPPYRHDASDESKYQWYQYVKVYIK